MKWTAEFGIAASWNMLSGIPGESDDWYAQMARWLPAIFHFQPPSGLVRVRYDRFSPYHTRAADYGLELVPSRAYSYVYPLPNESLMRLAYSFEDSVRPGHVHRSFQLHPGQRLLQGVLGQWNEVWNRSRPLLRVHDDGTRLRIVDTRPCARETHGTTGEAEAEVYRLCDSAQKPEAVLKQLSQRRGREVSLEEIEPAVTTLCEAGLLLRLNGKLLGLGINSDPAS